jgi:plasmid stabilization system protein ParE
MARYKIRYWMEAAEELEEAANWFAAEGPKTVEKWRRAFRETLEMIRQSPRLWAADATGIRQVLVRPFSYQIVYGLRGDVIEIFAVAHTSRHPDYWRKRLKKN